MSQEEFLCSIINCPNGDKGQVRSTVFYFVPKDRDRASKWADVLKGYVSDLTLALTKILICSSHFKPDAFEPNSKKLKIDAFPTIFTSTKIQKRNNSKIASSKIKENSVEPFFKKLKVTNLTSCLSKKYKEKEKEETSQNNTLQRLNIMPNVELNADPDASIPGERNQSHFLDINTRPSSSSYPMFSIGTKRPIGNNEKQHLQEKPEITNRSVQMEENMPGDYSTEANTNDINLTGSKESESDKLALEDIELRDEKAQGDIMTNAALSTSPNSRQNESETKEEYDIKLDNLHVESNVFLNKLSSVAGVCDDSNLCENAYDTENIKDLQILKQSLIDEHKRLRKQEEKLDLKLQQLRDEAKRKKATLQQSLPNEETDVLKKCFSTAQIRLLMGKITKSRWTLDDLAMAYTISSLSSRDFYNYLRTDLKYPLPAVSNINRCYRSKYRAKGKKNNAIGSNTEKGDENN